MNLIDYNIKSLEFARHNFLDLIKDLSVEQLNLIPEGFNNNLIWNFAHCVVVQKSMIYTLSGHKTNLSKELSIQYRNGHAPERFADADEIKYWKDIAISSIADLKRDYQNGLFQKYKEYKTSTGYHLSNVDDAINFNNLHEGLHYGVGMAMIKFIS